MYRWLVYETVEAPGGVVGGTPETEAVLPCLGALKKWMGLATPARQPLHPAFSESFVCPPGSLRSHIRQSADPSRSSTDEGCPARVSGCLASSVDRFDFFKIQRSALLASAGDGAKTASSSSRGRAER